MQGVNPCHITSCNRVNKEDSIIAGTVEGGKRAAATNKARHGADFYCNIGRKGGQNGNTGGFAANRELARVAGAKGGRISRKPKKKVTE